MKRKLVRSFERQIKWFKFIAITNIDVLRPTDAFNFDMAGNLSNHGLQELAIAMSKTIKEVDNEIYQPMTADGFGTGHPR